LLCICALTQENHLRNVTDVNIVIKRLLIRHTSLHIFELILEKSLLIAMYVVRHLLTVLRLLHISVLIRVRSHMNVKYARGHFLEGDLFLNIGAHILEKNHTLVRFVVKVSLRVGDSLFIFAHM
jgi:hypothetical protein